MRDAPEDPAEQGRAAIVHASSVGPLQPPGQPPDAVNPTDGRPRPVRQQPVPRSRRARSSNATGTSAATRAAAGAGRPTARRRTRGPAGTTRSARARTSSLATVGEVADGAEHVREPDADRPQTDGRPAADRQLRGDGGDGTEAQTGQRQPAPKATDPASGSPASHQAQGGQQPQGRAGTEHGISAAVRGALDRRRPAPTSSRLTGFLLGAGVADDEGHHEDRHHRRAEGRQLEHRERAQGRWVAGWGRRGHERGVALMVGAGCRRMPRRGRAPRSPRRRRRHRRRSRRTPAGSSHRSRRSASRTRAAVPTSWSVMTTVARSAEGTAPPGSVAMR